MYRGNTNVANRVIWTTAIKLDCALFFSDFGFAHAYERFTNRLIEYAKAGRAIGNFRVRNGSVTDDGEQSYREDHRLYFDKTVHDKL